MKTKSEEMKTTAFRLSTKDLENLDEIAKRKYKLSTKGNRAQVIRWLIGEAMERILANGN